MLAMISAGGRMNQKLTCGDCSLKHTGQCSNAPRLNDDPICPEYRPFVFEDHIYNIDDFQLGSLVVIRKGLDISYKIVKINEKAEYIESEKKSITIWDDEIKKKIKEDVLEYINPGPEDVSIVGMSVYTVLDKLEKEPWWPKSWKDVVQEHEQKEAEIDPKIKKIADWISCSGDPVKHIIDTHQTLHVGDVELAKTLLVSIGIQSVLNSDGIQPKVSGDSGKGKTHCCKAMAHLVPPEWVFEASLSDKAIFYMKDLKEGSIFFCDDANLSDTLEGVIKRATSSFQTGTTHLTLDIKRNGETKRIPPRISWWLTSVDDDQSLQLLNRQFGGGVDESGDQDHKVMEFQLKQAAYGEVGLPLNDYVLICREIIRDIKTNTYIVKIPFAKDIIWRDLQNRRNLPIFLDIIKSYTILRHRQREKDLDGALIADIQDYYDAKDLYTRRAENQGLKLTDTEMKLCLILAGRGEATRGEIAKAMGISVGRVSHLVYGKDKNKDAGLLHKVCGFDVEKRTVENSVGHKTQKVYLQLSGFDALGMFDSVVSLDVDNTQCNPSDTHTDTSIINNNIHTDTTNTHIERVKEKRKKSSKKEKSDSLLTQTSKVGISGISDSIDDDSQSISPPNNMGITGHTKSNDSGNPSITAIHEQVFKWAKDYEQICGPINSSNVVAAAMEYCKKHKVSDIDEVLEMFRKYAKIPPVPLVDPSTNVNHPEAV
jgi:DNA-binding CsgD family transcriptional regulator